MSQFATHCPNCAARWETDNGHSRLVGVDIGNDRIDHWRCPDCAMAFTRGVLSILAAGSTEA